MTAILPCMVVGLYRFWHGYLRLPGSGLLLRYASNWFRGLQAYPLRVPGIGTLRVDLRDFAGRLWLTHLLGDTLAPYDTEEGLSTAIATVLPNNGVFWDVGASNGFVTTEIRRRCPSVHILAFEPNPVLAESLTELFAGHPVKAFALALSDHDADVVLTMPKHKSVGASIQGRDYVMATSGLNADHVVDVPTRAVSGDSFLAHHPTETPPHVIKLDVEGHEVVVLRGLERTLHAHRPVVFFEHLYLSDDQLAALVPAGYRVRSVRDDGTLTERFDRSVGHNSVLLPI